MTKFRKSNAEKIGFQSAARRLGEFAILLCAFFIWQPLAAESLSPMTAGLTPALDLQGVWVDDAGNRHVVPFNYFDRKEMVLERDFDLQGWEKWPTESYLHFDGLAWSGDVFLNGRLLWVVDDPFAEVLLPIKKEWLKEKGNRVKVRLSEKGKDLLMYPQHFVGVFRPVSIWVMDTVGIDFTYPSYVDHAEKAVVVAPWSSREKYLNDSSVVAGALQGLLAYPFDHPVYFPFRPSSKALNALGKMGVKLLRHPADADSLAFYNTFPLHQLPVPMRNAFWRYGDGRPSPEYGKFYSWSDIQSPGLPTPDRMLLLLLLATPLLCLLLIKLVAPRFYSQMPEFLSKTQIYLELIGNNKFLKTEQRLLVTLFRLLIIASFISLYLYYLSLSGTWHRLNVFSDSSLLYGLFSKDAFSGYQIFLVVLGGLVGLHGLKYFFLNVAGGIFRYFNLGTTVQSLDIFAAFPMVFLPLLPAPFIFFADAGYGKIVLPVWYGLTGLYLILRILLIYAGLTRLFQFSRRLKILYICSLEILPWVILL